MFKTREREREREKERERKRGNEEKWEKKIHDDVFLFFDRQTKLGEAPASSPPLSRPTLACAESASLLVAISNCARRRRRRRRLSIEPASQPAEPVQEGGMEYGDDENKSGALDRKRRRSFAKRRSFFSRRPSRFRPLPPSLSRPAP